jgi:hypothetical protein
MKNVIFTIFFLGALSAQAQTNISAGNVYGTWKKTGSPFKINGNIVVPKDSTLCIEKGVKVEFQGNYSLEVKGSIQAIGAKADTVTFTAANKTTGWGGIWWRKTPSTSDSNIFHFCKFEYRNGLNVAFSKGAIFCDTVNTVRISNSVFQFNKSNYGAGVAGIKSRIRIYNCYFFANEASSSLPTRKAAGGSAINVGSVSRLFVDNCLFFKNRAHLPLSSTDSSNIESGATIYQSQSDTFQLTNSNFIENSATGTAGIGLLLNTSSNSLFMVKNCNFYRNSSKIAALFDFPFSPNIPYGKIIFDNLHIDGNITYESYGMNSTFFTWDGKFELNKIKITGISTKGNAILARNMTITNSYISGIDGAAIANLQNSTRIVNSVIVNNLAGAVSYDGGDLAIINSVVAYNGSKTKVSNSYQGGIVKGDVGAPRIHVVNSIVQGNRVGGKMYNITTTSGTIINTVKNTILEGGIDSALSITNNAQLSFGINTNNIFDTVQFIKAPKGVGVAFADTTCDFRVPNSCNYTSKILNAGINNNGFFSPMPSTDYYGNPRIKCNTIDIGPYELEGGKQSVSIDTEPTDQNICPKTIASITPTACGAGLSYQWQQSTNGTSFANISGANNANYSIKPQDSGWYRLIITQSECNKKDTSRAAKIAFKVGGKMSLITNAKDSTLCNKQPIALQANITNVNSYQWQESNDGSAFNNITGATSNPYTTNANATQWYRLIAKNTLCNYSDTFAAAKVTVNPLPTPNLGADIAIPNSGNKVLNPGTFTTYSWSTGASTPTLTVDKTNLAIGANNISVEVTGTNGCKAADTIIVTLEPANGLRDPSEAGIKVYPVPATETLHLDFPQEINAGNYTVCGMDGRVIKSGGLKKNTEIPLSELASGSYLLKLEIDGRVYSSRIVK